MRVKTALVVIILLASAVLLRSQETQPKEVATPTGEPSANVTPTQTGGSESKQPDTSTGTQDATETKKETTNPPTGETEKKEVRQRQPTPKPIENKEVTTETNPETKKETTNPPTGETEKKEVATETKKETTNPPTGETEKKEVAAETKKETTNPPTGETEKKEVAINPNPETKTDKIETNTNTGQQTNPDQQKNPIETEKKPEVQDQPQILTAVPGEIDHRYTLVSLSDGKTLTLAPTGSTPVYLRANAVATLKYTHKSSKGFKIFFSRVSGRARYSLSTEKETNDKWKIENDNNRQIINVQSDQKGFCSECEYILTITALEGTRVDVFVQTEEDPLVLRDTNTFIRTSAKKASYLVDGLNSNYLVVDIHTFYGTIKVNINGKDTEVNSNTGVARFSIAKNSKVPFTVEPVGEKATSAYQISVHHIDSSQKLLDGVETLMELKQGKATYFNFEFVNEDDPKNGYADIQIRVLGTGKLSHLWVSAKFSDKEGKPQELKVTEANNHLVGNYLDRSHSYKFETKKGIHTLQVGTLTRSSLLVGVTLRTSRSLTTNERYSSVGYVEEGQSDLYELYVGQKGKYAASVVPCQGSVKLSYAVGHESFIENKFQDSSNLQFSVDSPGNGLRLYAKVADDSAEKTNINPLKPRSAYKISAQPESAFTWSVKPGNDGKVVWNPTPQANAGQLQFDKVTITGHDEANDKFHVAYTLIGVLDESKLEGAQKCGNFESNGKAYITNDNICEDSKGTLCKKDIRLPNHVMKDSKVSAFIQARVTNLKTGDVATALYKTFAVTSGLGIESAKKDTTEVKPNPTDVKPKTTDEQPKTTEGTQKTTENPPKTTENPPKTTENPPKTTENPPNPTETGKGQVTNEEGGKVVSNWIKYVLIALGILLLLSIILGGIILYQRSQTAKANDTELTRSLARRSV